MEVASLTSIDRKRLLITDIVSKANIYLLRIILVYKDYNDVKIILATKNHRMAQWMFQLPKMLTETYMIKKTFAGKQTITV